MCTSYAACEEGGTDSDRLEVLRWIDAVRRGGSGQVWKRLASVGGCGGGKHGGVLVGWEEDGPD